MPRRITLGDTHVIPNVSIPRLWAAAGGLQGQCAYFHHTDVNSYNYTCGLNAESRNTEGGGINTQIKVQCKYAGTFLTCISSTFQSHPMVVPRNTGERNSSPLSNLNNNFFTMLLVRREDERDGTTLINGWQIMLWSYCLWLSHIVRD